MDDLTQLNKSVISDREGIESNINDVLELEPVSFIFALSPLTHPSVLEEIEVGNDAASDWLQAEGYKCSICDLPEFSSAKEVLS
jgi:hypothetical protein